MTTITSFINDIMHLKFNSPLARQMLRYAYREGKTYKIYFGPLQGIQLRYTESINFHAMLGLWELSSLRLLSKVIQAEAFRGKSGVVWDIGANIGLYSAWFSKNLPDFKIHAFEPAPFAKSCFRDLVDLNGLSNVKLHEFVFSDKIGEIEFFIGAHHHQSSLNEDWAGDGKIKPERLIVPSTTLDTFYLENRADGGPTLIKMDIEGGGAFALKNCEQVIRETAPYIWIESHDPKEDRAISNLLIQHGYEAFRLQTMDWVTFKNEIYPNKKGIWGDLLLCPGNKKSEINELIKK